MERRSRLPLGGSAFRLLLVLLAAVLVLGIVDARSARAEDGAVTADVVIPFEFPGLDPELVDAELEVLREAQSGGASLSDVIRDRFESLDLPDLKRNWVDFDGTIKRTSTGLALVIPRSEVGTQANWWQKAIAAGAGIATTLVVQVLCVGGGTAVLGPGVAAVGHLCAGAAGFMGGFVGDLINSVFDGADFTQPRPWLEALTLGLISAVAAMALTLWFNKWMMDNANWMLESLAPAIRKFGESAAWWAGSTARTITAVVGDGMQSVAPLFSDVWVASLKKLGMGRPMRVMPLGDSITYGVGSSDGNGYRDELWHDLSPGAGAGLNFVGTQRAGTFADIDNEGHSGRRIDEIADIAFCAVPSYRPNVVTLHAGTNDINQDYQLSTAPERLGALIDQTLAQAPEATVLVATLVPATKEGMQPKIDAYNARLPQIVQERRDQGKHVRLVSMSAVTTADLAQPAHPGDSGYAKMADAFFRGIAAAEKDGWLQKPVQGSGQDCSGNSAEEPAPSAAGPGWKSLGVIASGMSTPEGRTDLVELNGDNRADYVRIADDGTVRAALNTVGEPGKPDWVDQGIITRPNFPDPTIGTRIRFADMNGDNIDDYLEIKDDGSVDLWWRYANSSYLHPGGTLDPVTGDIAREAVRLADVNGDGRDDYLRVGTNGAIHAYFNLPQQGGNGIRWEEHLNWAPGVWYGTRDKLRLADVNGDRKADYLMVGANGQVHAYINNGGAGAGGFTERLSFVNPTGYPGEKSTFRDISGDGKADYIVVYDGGAIRCWLNQGGNT